MKQSEILDIVGDQPEMVFRTSKYTCAYVQVLGLEHTRKGTKVKVVEVYWNHEGKAVHRERRLLTLGQVKGVYAEGLSAFARKQEQEAREAQERFEEARKRREREQAVAHLNDIVTDRRRNELREALVARGLLGQVNRERDGGVYVSLILPPDTADVILALLKGETV
jgi:hypothetical protein